MSFHSIVPHGPVRRAGHTEINASVGKLSHEFKAIAGEYPIGNSLEIIFFVRYHINFCLQACFIPLMYLHRALFADNWENERNQEFDYSQE
ncbi:MAG: hypothetical protein HWN66_20070 [Candidatus Helarchaeota archaeon]|nr:hypothetical protein [Candidatus Helarchaeota archaeon]